MTKILEGNVPSPTEVVSNAIPRPHAIRTTEKSRQRRRCFNDRSNHSLNKNDCIVVGNATNANFDTYYGAHQTVTGINTEIVQIHLREHSANLRYREEPLGIASRKLDDLVPKSHNASHVAGDENQGNHLLDQENNKSKISRSDPNLLKSTTSNRASSKSTRPQSNLRPTRNQTPQRQLKNELPTTGQKSKNPKPKSPKRKVENVTNVNVNHFGNSEATGSKAKVSWPDPQGGILSCVRGGKVVGAKVAECILVTTEAYENEFGSKHMNDTQNGTFDEQGTVSTRSSSNFLTISDDGINPQDSGFRDNDTNRMLTKGIVPDSSLSESSSGVSAGNASKTLSQRFEALIAKDSTSSHRSLQRPPRAVIISQKEDTEDYTQHIARYPLHKENEIFYKNKPHEENSFEFKTDQLIRVQDTFSQRRPRGFYSNLPGDAAPYDEQAKNPISDSESEMQDLRSRRLEMFLQGKNIEPHNPTLSTAPLADDCKLDGIQQACEIADYNQKKEKDDSLYKSALRDLEAQDKIIQNLLQEYDNTKRLLSQTRKELERSKSNEAKPMPIMTPLDSDPRVKTWREAEDKLVSEIQENQNLLKKFIDLKEQTKAIKQWLSQPKDTEHGVPKTIVHSTRLDDIIRQHDMSTKPDCIDATPAGVLELKKSQIMSLRSQLIEAQSSRLATVERLVKMGREHHESPVDTKVFQRRLEKLKRDREETSIDKSISSSEEKEVYKLREEVSKLTKDLRISNNLCTDHRRKVSTLERELVTVNAEARKLRIQVDHLLLELHSTKRDYDDKNQSNLSEARLFQNEIRKMKQNLNSNL